MPAGPFTLLSLHKLLAQILECYGPWGNDSLANKLSFPLRNADDIALSTNTAHHLQLQLDRFHTYMTFKGLMLKAHETKMVTFSCSNPPMFCYYGTPLEIVHGMKYLGTALSHNGRMISASNQMACKFAGAIARVWKICSVGY